MSEIEYVSSNKAFNQINIHRYSNIFTFNSEPTIEHNLYLDSKWFLPR